MTGSCGQDGDKPFGSPHAVVGNSDRMLDPAKLATSQGMDLRRRARPAVKP